MGRAEKRRAERAKRAQKPKASAGGPVVSPVAAGFAAVLAAACLIPLARFGNPYPQGVSSYWAWGTLGIAGVVGALALIRSPVVQNLPQRCGAALMRPSPAAFATIAAATAAVLATIFAFYAFHRRATTSDELAQLWQAKVLLLGRFSLAPDPNPEFFALENVIDFGRWYAQFPIGGPIVLVPGALISAPWLVNPVLVAICVVALYWFARHVYGEMQGRAVAALFAVTPMVLFMAGTWMNHVAVLCLVTIGLAALMEWDRSATTRRRVVFAAGVGLALGLMATIRPLDAIIVAIPIGVFQLWVIRRDWRRFGELAVQGVLGVIGATPVLYANAATTGSPFRFGYEVMWGAGHQIGFRVDPYGNAHTVGRALQLGMRYIGELNMALMAWPTPGLLIVIMALLAFRRVTRWDVLLIALFMAQACAYASYSLVGELLGPRFLYTALPTLVVILARSPFVAGERAGEAWKRATLVTILACMVASWSTPWLRYSVWGLATDTRNTRRAMKVDIAGTVRRANVHRAVVFLHDALGERLRRRLWGLGFSRGDAARLLDVADVCSLITAVRDVESDTSLPPPSRPGAVARAVVRFVPGPSSVEAGDPPVRLSSRESVSPACRAELEADDRISYVPFGPALPLEPIGPDGRLDGDVIYAADLSDHNEVLRKRFGDRTWYRLTTTQAPDGSLRPMISPY